MAEQNTIIQLSEKNNKHSEQNNTSANGDWTTNVEDITLYKGDMLQMRSCFIDTVVQNSQLIDVEPDNDQVDYMTITTEHGYYLCEWGSTPTGIIAAVPDGPAEIPAGIPANNRKFIPSGVPADPNAPNPGNSWERTGNGHQYINCVKTPLTPSGGGAAQQIYKLETISISLIDNKIDSKDGNKRRGYFKYLAPGSFPGAFTKVAVEFLKNGNLSGHGAKYGAHPYQEITVETQGTYIVTGDGKPLLPLLMVGEFSFVADTVATPNNPDVNAGGTTAKEAENNRQNMTTRDHLNPAIQTTATAINTASGAFTPNTYKQEFRIPAKKYQPEELAIKLSIILSSVNVAGTKNHSTPAAVFSNNSFITTTENLANNNKTTDTPQYEKYCSFVKDTGEEIVYKAVGVAPDVVGIHATMVNEFIGTSTVDLSFNNNLFQFSQIHNSILDNDANNVTIACYDQQGTVADGKVFRTVANKAGGIYFSNLGPYDFWFNKLKFDPSILTKTTFTGGDTITVDGDVYYTPIITLIDGLNITGDIVGLGSAMRKPNPNFFKWEDAPLTTDRNINIESQYIPIIGNPVFNDNIVQESGYYQIEVDAGINHSHIKGQQAQNNKIKAIISKFYDQNAYTSAYSEGSITYEHTSDTPIDLSQFRVRILNSKGELASDYEQLGDDNTVFMEIIRGTNQSN